MKVFMLAMLATAWSANALNIDLDKLKVAAKSLLVDGTSNTAGEKYFESVDSIDRILTVAVNLPATVLGSDPAAAAPFDPSTMCDREWSCKAMDFETCPGMDLSTFQVRGFAQPPSSLEGYPEEERLPQLTWPTTVGKTYTLVFMDLLSPGSPHGHAIFHHAIFNIHGNDVQSGTTFRGFLPPGNPSVTDPHKYAFLLFEHGSALSNKHIADAESAAGYPFDWFSFQRAAGLTEADGAVLVATNWWNGVGSVASRVVLNQFGFGMLVQPCDYFLEGHPSDGVIEACSSSIDTTCRAFAPDDREL